jgi:hypothetical protein
MQSGDQNGNGMLDAGDAAHILYRGRHDEWPPILDEDGARLQRTVAQTTTLTLSDAAGIVGQEITVTLEAEALSGIVGGDFVVVYDPEHVVYVESVQPGALTADPAFMLRYFDDRQGRLYLAIAGDTPFDAGGTLVEITLRLGYDASRTTPLRLGAATLYDQNAKDFVRSFANHTIERHHGTVTSSGASLFLPNLVR